MRPVCSRSTRSASVSTRSPRTVQHRQPSESWMTPSDDCSTSRWSIATSPNSLMMTAVSASAGSFSSRLSSVVLPAPRKPVSTETGMGNRANRISRLTLVACVASAAGPSSDRPTSDSRGAASGSARRHIPAPPCVCASPAASGRSPRRGRPRRASGLVDLLQPGRFATACRIRRAASDCAAAGFFLSQISPRISARCEHRP